MNIDRRKLIGLSAFILTFIGLAKSIAFIWVVPTIAVVLLTFEDEIFGAKK